MIMKQKANKEDEWLNPTMLTTFDLGSWAPPLDQILDPHLLLQSNEALIYDLNC